MRGKICFFDFDGTLVGKDTFIDFGIFALGRRKFLSGLIKSFPYLAAWKMGLMKSSRAKERLFGALFKGISYSDFKEKGREYARRVKAIEREEIMKILDERQKQGCEIVIVSASIKDWISPWAETVGILTVLATEAEVGSDGLLTGRFNGSNCVGAEKVVRIKQSFPDVEDAETWAYGDSRSDDAMLSIVTHPQRV